MCCASFTQAAANLASKTRPALISALSFRSLHGFCWHQNPGVRQPGFSFSRIPLGALGLDSLFCGCSYLGEGLSTCVAHHWSVSVREEDASQPSSFCFVLCHKWGKSPPSGLDQVWPTWLGTLHSQISQAICIAWSEVRPFIANHGCA